MAARLTAKISGQAFDEHSSYHKCPLHCLFSHISSQKNETLPEHLRLKQASLSGPLKQLRSVKHHAMVIFTAHTQVAHATGILETTGKS